MIPRSNGTRTLSAWALGLTLTAAWLPSCALNDALGETPEERPTSTTPNATTATPITKLDLLWVVDNSGSMCQEQDHLRTQSGELFAELVLADVDFRVAVVTTDMEDVAQSGRFQNVPNAEPAINGNCNVATPDTSQCPGPSTTGEDLPPLVIDSTDARYLNEDGEVNLDTLQLHFGCNATVGVNGSPFEMGLEAAKTALSSPLIEDTNAGFLRDDAALAIIFVTDENDCSTDDGALLRSGNNCEWRRDELFSTAAYVDHFSGLKRDTDGNPDPNRVIMAAVIAPDNNQRYNDNETINPSCSSENGEGYAGYRYIDVMDSGGFPSLTENICALGEATYGTIGQHLVASLTATP